MVEKKRVGFYCWAGPGTIRMIHLKYFDPRINQENILASYDLPYLQAIKEKFGVTDVWISYSWGFAEEREQEDRSFTVSKLANFQQLGLRTHAYVQGPNLVYADFPDKTWWARDSKGKLISYHRGRKVVCLNNPVFQQYILNKVSAMAQLPFDGIFMDNIQMGQIGVPNTFHGSTFFGCQCDICQQLFVKKFGLPIAHALRIPAGREDYLQFRVESTSSFLKKIAKIVRAAGKEFGSNSFDPKFHMQHVYGTDLQDLLACQDYLLFENHSLPGKKGKNNSYIHTLVKESKVKKPVFVVSYDKGIGFDTSFTQSQIDAAFSEAEYSDFHLCLKGSEYVTNGEWHNLNPHDYQSPQLQSWQHRTPKQSSKLATIKLRLKVKLFSQFLPTSLLSMLFNSYMERRMVRKSLSWLQVWLLR